MIGLTVLFIAGAWLFVSMKFASFFASRCKRPLVAGLVAVLSFGAFAVLPFVDEIIGRLQFARLCKAEAVVWVGPNADAVVAAVDVGSFSERTGHIFPVRQQSIKYADLTNRRVFYTVTAFHTPGGALMRAGLGLGNSTSCWPERWTGNEYGIDIKGLIERGRQVQMLELFGTQLRQLRSPTAASPAWIQSMPEPTPLVGASRESVLTAFGAPDTCHADANDACLSERTWTYWFFRKSEATNTPVLRIKFGANDTVESAKWSFSR